MLTLLFLGIPFGSAFAELSSTCLRNAQNLNSTYALKNLSSDDLIELKDRMRYENEDRTNEVNSVFFREKSGYFSTVSYLSCKYDKQSYLNVHASMCGAAYPMKYKLEKAQCFELLNDLKALAPEDELAITLTESKDRVKFAKVQKSQMPSELVFHVTGAQRKTAFWTNDNPVELTENSQMNLVKFQCVKEDKFIQFNYYDERVKLPLSQESCNQLMNAFVAPMESSMYNTHFFLNDDSSIKLKIDVENNAIDIE